MRYRFYLLVLPLLLTGACGGVKTIGNTVGDGVKSIGNTVGRGIKEIPQRIDSPNACSLEQPASCGQGRACMQSSDGPRCKTVPMAPDLVFRIPFDRETEVVCTHSSGVGSHSWPNAFYALDLANDYELDPAFIRASAAGKAYVFLGEDGKPCPQPEGKPAGAKSSDCGQSWGNHVKILHAGGYFSLYAHLEKVLVENGATVTAGQVIGVEGWTGAAGHRHLHWSVQKLPGVDRPAWEKNILTMIGDSVPFNFIANQGRAEVNMSAANLYCPHANIGQADGQPRLRGL